MEYHPQDILVFNSNGSLISITMTNFSNNLYIYILDTSFLTSFPLICPQNCILTIPSNLLLALDPATWHL